MRLIQICLLTATIISCNSSGNKKEGSVSTEQQKKIDSLSNVIKDREEKDKQLLEAKEKQRELQATVSERNSVLSKVTIDKPAFIQLSLGGLEDIRFNLFNDYKYNVEQIVLKVHYIRANGTEIKS